MAKINITLHSLLIGEWLFDEAPSQLHAVRTADGFKLTLPSVLRLRWPDRESQPRPSVTSLHVALHVVGPENHTLPIGSAVDLDTYRGGDPYSDHATRLEWYGSISALQHIEKIRNGGQVQLFLACRGQGNYSYYNLEKGMQPLMSETQSFSGEVHIRYPKELWVDMLRRVGATSNVLVEIPLSPSPPTTWDAVWQAVMEARDQLELGGTTNWGGCIRSVRHALEEWQKIEKEDMGQGWVRPSTNDRNSRTKEQRLDNLRWHLLQVAHLAAHSSTTRWSRDEAVLLLSVVSALLAVRNP